MAQPGATVQLAEFLTKTNYQDLPAPVIEKSKELIIDQIGVALASSTLSWNRKVLEYVQDMGISGESQVVGTPYRTSLEYAALVNGTFGHGFELDDYCTPCGAHVGCVVFPAALAVGAKVGATGADFLGGLRLGGGDRYQTRVRIYRQRNCGSGISFHQRVWSFRSCGRSCQALEA